MRIFRSTRWYRTLASLGVSLPLLQVAGCPDSTLADAARIELNRLVTNFIFTSTQTVILNLLDA